MDGAACPQPCGRACELGEGRIGVVKNSAYVLFDVDDVDVEPPARVPTGASICLVKGSTEDGP